MNDQLARTLGIKFLKKEGSGRASGDLRITKTKSDPVRYSFSFSPSIAKKLGGFVRVAKTSSRIYIAPGCLDEYGWRLTGHKKGYRKYTGIPVSRIGFCDEFIGDHSVKYDSDLDVYYITKGEENERS